LTKSFTGTGEPGYEPGIRKLALNFSINYLSLLPPANT